MFSVLDFINVYDSEVRMAAYTDEQFTISYFNSAIHYTVYNDKLEIRINTYDNPKYSHYAMIYDSGMDWVVMFRRGVYGEPDTRVHYKRVSQGHSKVTPEMYNKLLLLKENVVYDHKLQILESGMKNAKT